MWSVPDWRGDDVYMILDNREKGIYRELIDQCWVAGGISSNPEDLARFVGEPVDYFRGVWAKIHKKFRVRGDGLISKRLEQDRRRLKEVRKKRKDAAQKGADQRWKDKRTTMPKPKEIHAKGNAVDGASAGASANGFANTKASPDTDTDTDADAENTGDLSNTPVRIPDIPSVRKEARHSGRTNGKTKKEFQKFWGPVEGYIRGQVVRESFQLYYAGCRILEMTAGYVVLAVPRALIERNHGVGTTAKLLAHTIEKSGTELLRDRALRVLPLEDLD
jgi:uncharacterized protein YdaU (DUF1376 family)